MTIIMADVAQRAGLAQRPVAAVTPAAATPADRTWLEEELVLAEQRLGYEMPCWEVQY